MVGQQPTAVAAAVELGTGRRAVANAGSAGLARSHPVDM